LYLDGGHKQEMLSAPTVAALEAFATQAGIAIDSARLYAAAAEKASIERELAMAAAIQRALLPSPRSTGGFFEVAASSLPSRTVGGDFFDYLDITDCRFGFTVADVAGKGPSAALLAAAVQSHFAALAPVCEDAAEVMTRVNLALLRRAVEARFATMFYAVITSDRLLSYCNAGQEPALLLREDGVTALSDGGPPVGLFEGAAYESGAMHVREGDLLVVYSDGITEARSPSGDWFGRERLDAVVKSCRGMAAENALVAILNAVNSFSASAPQADDITALVIRFR
jgi:sigma-B regulation protein RsbU (phosphoserine phosphatase)